MDRPDNTEIIDRFLEFYRTYCADDIGQLAQAYPNDRKSLYLDWQDLYRFDRDMAEDYQAQPGQMQDYAEEALRLYDLPADVKLGNAHVRMTNLGESTGIRDIRERHHGNLISVQGTVNKATSVRPKLREAAFECQRCGTLSYIPQHAGFTEPHQCEGCERQGPFNINFEQSEFVDAQTLRVQESPEGLRGGQTPEAIDVNIEDDITGEVTAGDHVRVTGILRLEQQGNQQEKSLMFEKYMQGVSVEVEDEEFEEMDITEEDKQEIIGLSNDPDIYEKMVASMAPSIWGYETHKKAIIFQLFSGVTKRLPDNSRIRGDLHMLLIGDPGTGKCLDGDTRVTLSDGSEPRIRDLVESNLDDPKPVDDGVWDDVDIEVPSMASDGSLGTRRATKVWKREAPERMYELTTESGRELTVTPSHPLFVAQDGDVEAVIADDLTEGEFVATPASLETAGHDELDVSYRRSRANNAVRLDPPEELQPWFARLLGYIVAEGHIQDHDSGSGTLYVTNNDREILDDVRQALERLGLNPTERTPHKGKDANEIVCSSSELVSFLGGLDPALLKNSAEQRVPEPIHRATSPVTRAFLRAYIDGEGTISPKQRSVVTASMSRSLLEDVRSLLLSFGIESQLHGRENGSYRLRISGDDFDRYVSQIGFVTGRKRAAAEEMTGGSSNPNRDVVPVAGERLRSVREGLGLTQADCGLPRSTYQHYERGDRNPSRASLRTVLDSFESAEGAAAVADGGTDIEAELGALSALASDDLSWDRIESINAVEPAEEWVYDLEVEGTHNYLSNGVVSHNSQLLQYVKNIAPRSVYTSGKGSSAAGLTATAVRDDFGEGDQWSLEAGALVLADKGIAAIDELDKMDAGDRSAMHEALEQQSISVAKAGINATLKSRCSLLGAANPKYGRFDEYESISEQIDLEPALISRFDLIFTITDKPDEEEDRKLARHIIDTNYAGELHTHRQNVPTANVSEEEVATATEDVEPAIDAHLLRKYVAHAKRSCYPTMTDEARSAIEEFYVDLRSHGEGEDAPVPVTARKLEALVRLAEASARVRLSDTVEQQDADRVIDIVRKSLEDVGMDPETNEFDADMIEAGHSKSQRDRIKGLKAIIQELEDEYEEGAPYDEVLEMAVENGTDRDKAEHEIEKLKQRGEVYEPSQGHLRTT
ncbi:LAGLIDADG family homing endonuclease [Haloglomus halophilum]|uniref:LAGLIDADG family homing endonuclease n=1 Tax=Haloglomus halophilum TaxID=2962672 RepID=UPI0020C9D27E|nr:LAGLIDADG family homing endonuclease [Haloglomus halophilum]